MRINSLRYLLVAFGIMMACSSGYSQNRENSPKASRPGAATTMRGPGPVTSISSNYNALPQIIKNYLHANFAGTITQSVTEYTLAVYFDIVLNNGYKLKITHYGQLLELQAPSGRYINEKLIKRTLPSKAYKYLKNWGYNKFVVHLLLDKKGNYDITARKNKNYNVQKTFTFDSDGNDKTNREAYIDYKGHIKTSSTNDNSNSIRNSRPGNH